MSELQVLHHEIQQFLGKGKEVLLSGNKVSQSHINGSELTISIGIGDVVITDILDEDDFGNHGNTVLVLCDRGCEWLLDVI